MLGMVWLWDGMRMWGLTKDCRCWKFHGKEQTFQVMARNMKRRSASRAWQSWQIAPGRYRTLLLVWAGSTCHSVPGNICDSSSPSTVGSLSSECSPRHGLQRYKHKTSNVIYKLPWPQRGLQSSVEWIILSLFEPNSPRRTLFDLRNDLEFDLDLS